VLKTIRAREGGTALLIFALLALPAAARGWGDEVHRLVNEKAAGTLPAPLEELFTGNVAFLRAHSVDPDLWRAHRQDEDRNHTLDISVFDDLVSGEVPRSEREHLLRHGPEAVERGRLPWRIAEVHRDLVAAFRARDERRVLERAAVLGHYAADAFVPLHADIGGDAPGGVHARLETELFVRFEHQIEPLVTPGPAEASGDPVAVTLRALRDSLARAPAVLEAERAAAGERDFVETDADDRHDDGYYSRLFEHEGERYAARLAAAAEAVGALWLSAWHKAGRARLDWSFRASHVRGRSRLVVAVLEGAGAELVNRAVDRGAMPHLDALAREGSFGRIRPPFPARRAAAQATLWTGAWPDTHGVVGDGVPRATGSVLETTAGDRSGALGAEPLWVTAAREGVPTIVVGVAQSAPFGPFLGEKRHGGDFGRHLVLLAPAAVGISAAVLTGRDLARRPAASWTGGKSGSSALEVDIPVAEGMLPGLLFDDPDDPASGLDTLALSASRDLSAAVRLKPVPAGRDKDPSRAMLFHTAKGEAFVHFRLFSLSPDGREIVLWHSSGAHTVASQPRVQAAVSGEEGLLDGGAHHLYTEGRFGAPLWDGGDGTAERRYLETVRIAVRQRIRLASFVLDRTRWGLAILALPFPAETLGLWMGRLDPTRPDHDPAVAVRLRPFLDDALRLADTWVGEIARRVPSDGALAVVGDRGLAGVDRVARPNVALEAAGLLKTRDDGTIDLSQTKVVYAPANGGFLVVNRDSRPDGMQPRRGESLVRASSIGATREMRDPSTGEKVIAELLVPDERGAPPGIGGPSGGFLYLRPAPGVVLSPETRGPAVGPVETRGDAFDPGLASATGVLVLDGHGVAGGRSLGEVRSIDVAPTLAWLLGIPAPKQAQGERIERALGTEPAHRDSERAQ